MRAIGCLLRLPPELAFFSDVIGLAVCWFGVAAAIVFDCLGGAR
jgi:hypothetical protein